MNDIFGKKGEGSKGGYHRGRRNRGGGGFDYNTGGGNGGGAFSGLDEWTGPKIFRTQGHDRLPVGPIFDFRRLLTFLKMDPNDVLLFINPIKDDWKNLLESEELSGDKLVVAIQVFGEKICAGEGLPQLQVTAVNACFSAKVTSKMEDLVSKIMCNMTLSSEGAKSNFDYEVDTSPMNVLKNLYELCHFVMKTMPSSGVDYFQAVISKAIGCVAVKDSTSNLLFKFKALGDQINALTTKNKEAKEGKKQYRPFNEIDLAEFDGETPPDNFKDLETIPTVEELRQAHGAYIRPNKPTGAYLDCNHYLDVQFRLLREDFVKPLREGVRKFLKDPDAYIIGTKRMPLGEGRLYTNVKIVKVVKEKETVVYKLQLPEATFSRVNWDRTRRLMTGSLVLLTTIDNCFEPGFTYFGVIFSHEVPELIKGIVSVSWEGSPPAYHEGRTYLMFESEVYLEAYRHTLDTLKNLELEIFPMKKFIVDATNEVDYPAYLKNAKSPLMLKTADGCFVNVSHDDEASWPTEEDFGFDENQLRAFRAAVTKEFSIIQGPPGTGKTFLGLKVAETLLNNSDLVGGPITVVCYTNHALDQFLEGVLLYYERERKQPEIIRIGGRCKSEALADHSLRNVRNRFRRNRELPKLRNDCESSVRQRVYRYERERSTKMDEITGLQDLRGIVDFESLSVWRELRDEYPQVLWERFRDVAWFGIENKKLEDSSFDEKIFAAKMFKVREFPKDATQAKLELGVKRITLSTSEDAPMETDVEEEELDEYEDYMYAYDDDPYLDEIFLEARFGGDRLSYFPGYSVKACGTLVSTLNHFLARSSENPKTFAEEWDLEWEWDNVASTPEMALTVLKNRKSLLTEIFRLRKEQLIDLPNVRELLNRIRNEPDTMDFDELQIDERWALLFAVAERASILTAEKIAELEKYLTDAQRELRDILQLKDGLLLQCCKVVGLTTTGAAKNNGLLKMIGSKIVIVEEAAEVFEAHIVTCITKHCEQLILIGDHRQLRPSPTVYELARMYNLDLSLFERMINNKLHCYQLKTQHRMRPDISDLVTGTIYADLENHESVKQYPDVLGITKNVFFVTHSEKENAENDSTSKSNVHEAKFIAALARHLILQGYKPNRITVLTMYTGQMLELRQKMNALDSCRGIRVTCVDNFQGEENDVILLSLVRSNDEGEIGFLNIDNRICVSVSRAKHGLYVIGNIELLEEKSKTWRLIKQKLVEREQIGDALEIECQIHQTRAKVRCSEDFRKFSAEGGCMEMCDGTLRCGHRCPMVCHVVDREHVEFQCPEPCPLRCPNNSHPCKGSCSEDCPECDIPVEQTLICGHTTFVPCCLMGTPDLLCNEVVEKKLPCGHTETMACYVNERDYQCKVKVQKKLLCSHENTVACYVDPLTIRCKAMNPIDLPCGHSQIDECGKDPKLVICDVEVVKKFSKCGHEKKMKCSSPLAPFCSKECELEHHGEEDEESQKVRDKWIKKLSDSVKSSIKIVFPELRAKILEKLLNEECPVGSLDFIANSATDAAVELVTLRNSGKLLKPEYEKAVHFFQNTFNRIMSRLPLNNEDVAKLNDELDRVDYFKQLMIRRSFAACNEDNPDPYLKYLEAEELLLSKLWCPWDSTRERKFLKCLKELDEFLSCERGVTVREKYEIPQTVRECGAPVEKSKSKENGTSQQPEDKLGASEESDAQLLP